MTSTIKPEINKLLDTTIKHICFDLPQEVNINDIKNVCAEKFKKYEYILYLMAQLSRIVYCDTGIIWYVIERSLGMSNDVVNEVITKYDNKYKDMRTQPIKSQRGDDSDKNDIRPMESYSIKKSDGTQQKYATYIATPDDMVCLIVNASKVKKNNNSILNDHDIILAFKGTNSIENVETDFAALFATTRAHIDSAFLKPILNGWNVLIKALIKHIELIGNHETRLFMTGQSLGGAFCTLFGFLLANAKANRALPDELANKIKSIHIISCGAPTIVTDESRIKFNRYLDNGFVTLDRIVSQKIPSVTAAMQLVTGGLLGPNDSVGQLPLGFSHLGYQPLIPEIFPEKRGRPYSIDDIRESYGIIGHKTRSRDLRTWPFENNEINLNRHQYRLNNIVNSIVKIDNADSNIIVNVESEINIVKKIIFEKIINKYKQPENKQPENKQPENKQPENKQPENKQPENKQPENKQPENKQHKGGFGSKYKEEYEKITKYRIPNLISVAGDPRAYIMAHVEYLGMFFWGVWRLKGMKDPAKDNKIAYFELDSSGVKISYTDFLPSLHKDFYKTILEAFDGSQIDYRLYPIFQIPQSAGSKSYKNYIKYKTRYLELKNNHT